MTLVNLEALPFSVTVPSLGSFGRSAIPCLGLSLRFGGGGASASGVVFEGVLAATFFSVFFSVFFLFSLACLIPSQFMPFVRSEALLPEASDRMEIVTDD